MDNQNYKKSEVTIQPSGLMFNWEDTFCFNSHPKIDLSL